MTPGIVAFHIMDWALFEGTQTWHYILRGLSAQHPCLYVAAPMEVSDAAAALRGRPNRRSGLRRVGPSLHVYTPPAFLPRLYRWRTVASITRTLRHALLRTLIRRLGISPVIQYVFHPACLEEAQRLPAALHCYHVYDNYRAFGSGLAAQLAAADDALLKTSDLVFAVSRPLYDRCLARNPNSHLVPNGVDLAMFEPGAEAAPSPDALKGMPRPRLAYTGTVNEHVDIGLLRYLAESLPGWQLVLMGKVALTRPESQRAFSDLCRMPNVHFLGFKPPQELPAYLREFDVGLIPYRMNEVVRFGSPQKLNLYLAAGKPVVAAPMPCMAETQGLVATAGSPAEWLEAVRRAVADVAPEQVRQRQAFARRNGWQERVERIERLIQGALGRAVPAQAVGTRS